LINERKLFPLSICRDTNYEIRIYPAAAKAEHPI